MMSLNLWFQRTKHQLSFDRLGCLRWGWFAFVTSEQSKCPLLTYVSFQIEFAAVFSHCACKILSMSSMVVNWTISIVSFLKPTSWCIPLGFVVDPKTNLHAHCSDNKSAAIMLKEVQLGWQKNHQISQRVSALGSEEHESRLNLCPARLRNECWNFIPSVPISCFAYFRRQSQC